MKLNEDEMGSIALCIMAHGGGAWETFSSFGLIDNDSNQYFTLSGVSFVHNSRHVVRVSIAKTRNSIETMLAMQMSQELHKELINGNTEALRNAEVYQLEIMEARNV